jgi:hypothetical protein
MRGKLESIGLFVCPESLTELRRPSDNLPQHRLGAEVLKLCDQAIRTLSLQRNA